MKVHESIALIEADGWSLNRTEHTCRIFLAVWQWARPKRKLGGEPAGVVQHTMLMSICANL